MIPGAMLAWHHGTPGGWVGARQTLVVSLDGGWVPSREQAGGVGNTHDIYSHVLPDMQQQAAAAMEAALGGKSV